MFFILKCPTATCGKQIQVSERVIGKRVKCPKCGTLIPVHDGTSRSKPEEPRPSFDPQMSFATWEDSDLVQVPPQKQCPACGSMTERHALVCLDCGFNFTTGEQFSREIKVPQSTRRGAPDAYGAASVFWPWLVTGVPLLVASVFCLYYLIRSILWKPRADNHEIETIAIILSVGYLALGFFVWKSDSPIWRIFFILLCGGLPAAVYWTAFNMIAAGMRGRRRMTFGITFDEVKTAILLSLGILALRLLILFLYKR